MDMNINAKSEIKLSISSLDDYIKALELKKEQILKTLPNIATRLAEEAGRDTYKSVVTVPAEMQGETAVAYARSTDQIDTYREFGTGIVGSKSPHIDKVLEDAHWKYDVNGHGEKGWKYPKKDGTFGWTSGQPAQKKFYQASQRAKEKAPEIAKEEFQKYKNQ